MRFHPDEKDGVVEIGVDSKLTNRVRISMEHYDLWYVIVNNIT